MRSANPPATTPEFVRLGLALAILLGACRIGWAETNSLSWQGARWIWGLNQPGQSPDSIPAQSCYFRRTFAVTERARIQSADVVVTADNLCEVFINGHRVGGNTQEPNHWNQPKRFDIAELLSPGNNTLAVEAVNTLAGPAGLLLKVRVVLADGTVIEMATDRNWLFSLEEAPNWVRPDFNPQGWRAATELKNHGEPPWNALPVPSLAQEPETQETAEAEPSPEDYAIPGDLLFIAEDCSLNRPEKKNEPGGESLGVTVFTAGTSRAFPEHDLPGPIKVGRKLCALTPKPGAQPRVLVDAGQGALGSPTVSFDGDRIYFSMVKHGDAFFHIYHVPANGGPPVQLTFGNFHDIDPVELPDGRIAFVSTRCGMFEEYHNTPSRALFTMNLEGGNIQPLTSTFIFDNEPKVMADGRILFVRSDNFFDRGKVETLLHAVHPDGTHGYTEFGMDMGPAYDSRLRAFYCGSPAPMPDGRVAYVTGSSVAIGRPGGLQQDLLNYPLAAGDVAALPDGRLLATTRGSTGQGLKRRLQADYNRISIFHPDAIQRPVTLYESPAGGLHSPAFLGERPRPPVLAASSQPRAKTGILVCQDARRTRNTDAGWPHVRAVRVLMGKGLTMRSSHSYIVHAGNETVDLGTVPLAPDGSFAVEVPADAAIAFQAVDAEGRAELNEMSWIYVRGGETRGCVGCHSGRQEAPPDPREFVMAAAAGPLRLAADGDPHRFRGNNAAVTGMMELQFDRFREVAGLNTLERTSADLVNRLNSADSRERIAALNRLALAGDTAAAPAIARLLKDPVREARVAAAMGLAASGTGEQIPALEMARHDPEPPVRWAVDIALENFARSEDELVANLASNDRDAVRRAAAALGHTARKDSTKTALRNAIVRWRDDPGYKTYRFRGDDAKFSTQDPANPRMIQELIRATGRLQDQAAVPLLATTLKSHSDPDEGNLFVAEAAADALGLIGTPEAAQALAETFAGLKDYVRLSQWYGDHEALIACHMSPVHYRILGALDRIGVTNAAGLVPHAIRCLPTDFDRALFTETDAAEMLIGRFIRHQEMEAAVVETCLSILGDPEANSNAAIREAIGNVHGAWAGTPTPENRAAQVLSIVVSQPQFSPRIRAIYSRSMALPNDIPRVFSQGIPVLNRLPARHWICFYLARALGRLGDAGSVDLLISALQHPSEFADGSPDPLGPGLIFLHNDLTPCWRAGAAWALGRIGDQSAVPELLNVVKDFSNATETRHAAAVALGQLGDPSLRPTLLRLANTYPERSTRQALLDAAASGSMRSP